MPKWINILKLTNPGTKVAWKTIPLIEISRIVHFMRGFFGHLGHVLKGLNIVDQLYKLMARSYMEKNKGKLLTATSIDTNGHIFPLAFAIVEEKSQDSCLGFLSH